MLPLYAAVQRAAAPVFEVERIEIIDVMPRNPSGKVPKHELRARIMPPRV